MIFNNLIKKSDFVDQVKGRAYNIIKNKRQFKQLINEQIYDFCRQNKIIINNEFILMDESSNKKNINIDQPIVILCDNSHTNGIKLSDYLYDKGFKEIRLSTQIYNKKQNIYWKQYHIVVIYETKIRFNSIFNIYETVKINNLLYMNYVDQLIQLYYKLYNLDYGKELENNVKLEQTLYDNFVSKKIYGGHTKNEPDLRKKYLSSVSLIKKKFMTDFLHIENNKIILIDKYAVNILTKNKLNYKYVISFISICNFKIIYNLIKNFIAGITNFSLSYKQEEIGFVHDKRLKKYIISLCVPNKIKMTTRSVILFNIYNLCDYSVVPYNEVKNIKIGNKFILLYFLLINHWTIRKLFNFGKINKNKYNELAKYYILAYNKIRKLIINSKLKDKYAGTYFNDYIYYKQKFIEKPTQSYYPMLKKK